MPEFSPSVLADWTGGVWRGPVPGRVAGFSIDSRTLSHGELFVAIRSKVRDGHDFLRSALEVGASGALVSSFDSGQPLAQLVVPDPIVALQSIAVRHRAGFGRPVIAITGSCGKTSTKDLIAIALGGVDRVLSTIGNLNNFLGVPLTLLRIDPNRHQFAVIETGISQVGEMDGLAAMVQPEMGVVCNLAPAHLDHFGSIEIVAREKSRLFRHLRPGGKAVFPVGCLEWKAFRTLVCETVVIGSGKEGGIDEDDHRRLQVSYQATQVESGMRIDAVFDSGKTVSLSLDSTSPGMASNAVLALTVADRCGIDPVTASDRLASWTPAPLRGEIRISSGRMVYVDCYNANPDSMIDAVRAFNARVPEGSPRLFVIGCMDELGTETAVLHADVGRAWPRRSGDRFAIVGDQAEDLRQGLLEAGQADGSVVVAADLDELSSMVGTWPGALFIKGSRRYRLESLLASLARGEVGEEAAC
ncbi:MAG: UDP-N-acetylmuramoyl-tripeptide--D-alanyl-D-alanine ligase [Verrucomicrobia bacterium]|nr:MAG: UDP-N-acetylmuramoyl-tripeptide--D-alanyl-D-alanine ligase [Verrucomicrobiota bacterium]